MVSVITGLVPVIPIYAALPCRGYRDCRDKPGNDELIRRGARRAEKVRGKTSPPQKCLAFRQEQAVLAYGQPGEKWMAFGMMRCAAVAGALFALLGVTSASAEVRIQRDFGGQIGPYLYKYAMVREAGHKVVIDGPCLSACTLALAVIPRERICMTPNAILGFHAAWMPGTNGRPVVSPGGTRLLMAVYPPQVRNWIKRRGGLNGKTIFLRGRELAALYPSCG